MKLTILMKLIIIKVSCAGAAMISATTAVLIWSFISGGHLAPQAFAGISNSQKEIPVSFDQGSVILLGVCVAVTFLSTLISFLLSRNILSDIDTFMIYSRQASSGNLSTRVDAEIHGEFGELGKNLNVLMNNLESRDRTYRQWLSNTSHEIRTPLAVLRAQIEALQDGVHEANDQTLAILHAQVLHLSRVMNIGDTN